LVKGASQGEGLGNKFLGELREVDALLHVVRCFEEEGVSHVYTTLDPLRDIEIVTTELAIADLEVVERRLERVKRDMKGGEKRAVQEHAALGQATEALAKGQPLRWVGLSEEAIELLKPLDLLTQKPLMYVANADEAELEGQAGQAKYVPHVMKRAQEEGAPCIVVCGKLEEELGDLEESERGEFLKEMGLTESGLERLIHMGYGLLDLVTFYTVVGKELRAWTIPQGTKAQEAAGKIHTDMEKGFIKADVIPYEDFVKAGSEAAAREKGIVRVEGKEYLVRDGDILHIKF